MSVNTLTLPKHLLEQYTNADWGGKRLGEINLFSEFHHQELKELYQRGEIKLLNPNTHAVIEGEQSRGLFIILSGSVSVYKNSSSSGSMMRIAILEEGKTFGEMSLLDKAARSATVTAETSCVLFCLDAKVFEKFLEESGDNLKVRFYRTCAEDLSKRFRAINADYIAAEQLLWRYALRRNEGQITS